MEIQFWWKPGLEGLVEFESQNLVGGNLVGGNLVWAEFRNMDKICKIRRGQSIQMERTILRGLGLRLNS